MKKDYDSFIRFPDTFPEGIEVKFMVRDCSNYRYIPIKGKIFKDLEKAPPDSHNLWLRDPLGMKSEKPWGLQIIEEFEEKELFNPEFHWCAPKG
jgi:hypothetical protein